MHPPYLRLPGRACEPPRPHSSILPAVPSSSQTLHTRSRQALFTRALPKSVPSRHPQSCEIAIPNDAMRCAAAQWLGPPDERIALHWLTHLAGHCFQVIADKQGSSRCKHAQGNSRCLHPHRPEIGCCCARVRHRPRRPSTIRRLRRGGLWVSTCAGRATGLHVHALLYGAQAPIAGAKRGKLASERACTAACIPQARGLQITAQRWSPGAPRCFSAHRRGCPARLRLSMQSRHRQLLAPWPAAPWGLCQGERHCKHPALACRPAP